MSSPRLRMLRTGPAVIKLKQPAPIQATKRIAGNSLYAIMKRFARDNPQICKHCQESGLTRAGDELDHIVPLHLGGSNDYNNLQWLCRTHHLEKTKKEEEERSNRYPGG